MKNKSKLVNFVIVGGMAAGKIPYFLNVLVAFVATSLSGLPGVLGETKPLEYNGLTRIGIMCHCSSDTILYDKTKPLILSIAFEEAVDGRWGKSFDRSFPFPKSFLELFDGRIGKKLIVRPNGSESLREPFLIEHRSVSSKIDARLSAGMPVLATTNPKTRDPEQWKPTKPNNEIIQIAKDEFLRVYPDELKCVTDDGDSNYLAKTGKKMDRESLRILKRSFRSKNGKYLVGVKGPLATGCYPNADPEPVTDVIWIFIGQNKMPRIVKDCPRCHPLDAADFSGTGTSSWIFVTGTRYGGGLPKAFLVKDEGVFIFETTVQCGIYPHIARDLNK